MKRIAIILNIVLAFVLISCQSCGDKDEKTVAKNNTPLTLTELVQDVEETPQMGIWKVEDLHSGSVPTIEAQRVKDTEGKQTCWFTTYFPNSSNFNVKLWGSFPRMEVDEYAYELHMKSENQEEIIIYGNTDYRKKDASFDAVNSKQIIRYLSEATSPVTLTFVGVPKNMTFEIPTEGFKEVCKCWYNALKEKGNDRCLK